MNNLTNSINKEDVFNFNKEVKILIKLLTGITLYSQDTYRLKEIENQIYKLSNLTYKFEPTTYDEYSLKTKFAYKKMLHSKKEYDRVIKENCTIDTINEYKVEYEKSKVEYEKNKTFRDELKKALDKIK